MNDPAKSAADVISQAALSSDMHELDANISACRACPRLVDWRERVAREKRRSFATDMYWGRPVPGFGAEHPRILIVGLAPAAHGGNRTGRVFTGDRSGDWLYASMFRVGLANQPESISVDDGLRLEDTRILAAVRCAPPANKPTPTERDVCAPWLDRELELARLNLRSVVALGSFAYASTMTALARAGYDVPRPRPRFAHGVEVQVGPFTVFCCFHPSQQNTFTGKLTEPMLDEVLHRAAVSGRRE